MANNRFFTSTLVCQTCNNTVQIQRKNETKRPNGHIKDMYCPYCKMDSKFKEKQEWGRYKTLADVE